jgi:hypothetical protein
MARGVRRGEFAELQGSPSGNRGDFDCVIAASSPEKAYLGRVGAGETVPFRIHFDKKL